MSLLFNNGGRLVTKVAELPDLRNAKHLYLDFETRSGDPTKDSTNPWHNCRVLGFAITADDVPGAWYIPIDHEYGASIDDPTRAYEWLCACVRTCKEWVNHNIKYDAHVYANDVDELGVPEECRLICTLTAAKLIDSDRMMRGGYGLDALSSDWLGEDISKYYEAVRRYTNSTKDWGECPSDIMAEYGCQDVLTERRLHKYILARMPEDCKHIWEIEIATTKTLYEAERWGSYIIPQELQIKELMNLNRMSQLERKLSKIVGQSFRPHVNEDCYEVLCGKYGLPVLGVTDTGNPSFDKEALRMYQVHPLSPMIRYNEELKQHTSEFIDYIIEYRKLNTLTNFFVNPYQTMHIENILHPTYNQLLQTGRMGCSEPNMQQLDKSTKDLIHPRPGYKFLCVDWSQIEFRLIVHYINDRDAIRAYNENPDTDFHQWVADVCGMARKPAKNVNFMMGYGGGKGKCVSMLAQNTDVIGKIVSSVKEDVEAGRLPPEERERQVARLCKQKAESVYNTYHDNLPSLKSTSKAAARACAHNGFVRTLHGRRRHLPEDKSWLAFNTANQGSAADMMKERLVKLAAMLKNTGIMISQIVHDEVVMEGPAEAIDDDRTVRDIINVMEHPEFRDGFKLKIPVRCSYGRSEKTWREASSQELKLDYSPAECGALEHLKTI